MNSKTLWGAVVGAVMVFIGTMLNWTPEQLHNMTATVVGLVLAIMGQGIGAKSASAKVEVAKIEASSEATKTAGTVTVAKIATGG